MSSSSLEDQPMLASQYVVDLPEAFDMQAIRDRVAAKGPVFDAWPGLALKLFLLDEPARGGAKRYGTFYLWRSSEALQEFLAGPAFAAVVAGFGRPRVRVWLAQDVVLPEAPVRSLKQMRLPLPGSRPLAEAAAAAAAEVPLGSGRALLLDPADWSLEAAVMSGEARVERGGLLHSWEVLHTSRPACSPPACSPPACSPASRPAT